MVSQEKKTLAFTLQSCFILLMLCFFSILIIKQYQKRQLFPLKERSPFLTLYFTLATFLASLLLIIGQMLNISCNSFVNESHNSQVNSLQQLGLQAPTFCLCQDSSNVYTEQLCQYQEISDDEIKQYKMSREIGAIIIFQIISQNFYLLNSIFSNDTEVSCKTWNYIVYPEILFTIILDILFTSFVVLYPISLSGYGSIMPPDLALQNIDSFLLENKYLFIFDRYSKYYEIHQSGLDNSIIRKEYNRIFMLYLRFKTLFLRQEEETQQQDLQRFLSEFLVGPQNEKMRQIFPPVILQQLVDQDGTEIIKDQITIQDLNPIYRVMLEEMEQLFDKFKGSQSYRYLQEQSQKNQDINLRLVEMDLISY
ncbi:hypothetical protein PPERSA_02744 [Pseudocohnilembus persalinus]|uniref:RGS domain-containing protein n=1 Tax=Pseudocohnilembus persalinus TaxID=266149 RepID=A0A0V0R751_PSEPJ|nr:hypothetical protein PPERSA_02744 [Pseudocohnilembus persalinus]|eukprot:KRX10327.1 hypothetical protein PPERSA_02744 [Pseudocohnilembus persalinus]